MKKEEYEAVKLVLNKTYFKLKQITRKRLNRKRIVSCLCALVTFSFGVASINAQVTQNSETNPGGQQEEIKLNFQDVDIRALISTVAEVSGKNFIVDPRVKGKVSVVSGKSVTPEELYDYFLAILEVHNYATVGSGSVIKVVPSNVIKQKPTNTLFSPTEQDNDEQITQIIRLQHAAVADLVTIIRPLIPPTSHFAQHASSNSVILTDTAANIQRVLKIIRSIDVPDKRSNTHVVYLEKTSASDMANSLTQLISSTADPAEAAQGGSKLSIQPFEAINALVISATDEQFARVKALIDELDVERELAGDVSVIPLNYANAEDLVSILNDVTASNTQGAASDFNVQADEASNSLIVKASGGQLKTVQSVVEELDKRRAQVFVETIIAEVALTKDGTLGVTWNAGVPAPEVVTTAADGTTTTATDFRANTVGSRAGTGLTSSVFPVSGTANGFNYQLFDFGRYQLDLVLNAIRSDSNSNVLSTPTILTLDNEEAEIIVGQEVPFVTGVFNNGITNSTNPDGTPQTTGTALGTGFQTIERRDVGIQLRIKPQINQGDTIQLEVFQETSSVATTEVQGQADLITNRRSIEAVVQVDDGQVVALGGLITDDVTDTVSWVPILGKLPLLGNLFRNKTKSALKRNLMVFLKPRIIRTPEELALYSKEKYDDIRRDEIIYSNKNDDVLLMPESEPPVLLDYEEAIEDGTVSTESQQRQRLKGEPKKNVQRRVKDIIFGRKTKTKTKLEAKKNASQLDTKNYKTQGNLEDLEAELKAKQILEELERKKRQSNNSVIDLSSSRNVDNSN